MRLNPKEDASFQSKLAEIMKGAGGMRNEEEEAMIDRLVNSRVIFFEACCYHYVHTQTERVVALEVLNITRNTPEAQRFLLSNPQFFTQLDRELCRLAVEWRRKVAHI